ncbi:MAG: DNA-directed DNA polymerase alpha catalytic subunit pol1 [Sclerophora amabilis]|nr:MAG: DNA-directed DNA polymerase alpha catalytic subunit pol1 [Sclerophora amabilis]
MSARSRLAELRALRASGKKRLSTYEVPEEEKLYEEVDEEGYKRVVRDRLNQDDFVIDDNGQGYADDGREDWLHERRAEYDSESEDELPTQGKAGKRKREEEREKKERIDKGINKYFSTGVVPAQPKAKPVKTEEEAAFMADLLSEVDRNIPSRRRSPPVKAIKSDARRKVRVLSPPSFDMEFKAPKKARLADEAQLPNTPPVEPTFDDDDGFLRGVDDDQPMSDQQLPSSPVTKAVERKAHTAASKGAADDEEDLMEVSQPVGHSDVPSASVNISGSRPAPKPKVEKTAYPSPDSSSPTRPPANSVDPSIWNDVTTKLNVLSSSSTPETASFGKVKPKDVLEEDGSLRMFWLDYTEVNGSLCLFGKVKDKSTGAFVSCFVKIDNILRKLFFLPREYRQRHGRDTPDEVEMKDVYEEVDELMSKLHVGMHKIKPCSRKYAFEQTEVPREADYLKLLYPYNKSLLPMDLKGDTFSHVFGTNTALFEQFVLWRNVKGPCWLKMDEVDFSTVNGASWCKFEAQVSKPGLVTPLGDAEDMEAPPLTLMSIALRTTLNVKENKQEILVASARIYENISLSDTSTPPEKLPCQSFTIIRPAGANYPLGFEAEAKKHKGAVRLEKTEQGLLSLFLAKLQKVDPDVLVGHQLEGVDYSILLSRMRERKTPSWHRIGRLKRSEWPKNMGKVGGSFFAERQLVSGRLLCDLANDLGKSLMTKCQSWSLTEMCELILGKGNIRQEIDNEAALKSWAATRDGLMNYLNHCEADTYFIAAIALKVQMLPLTKVLTNLAGNTWARTLSGTRAERNEYILLHEFHKNKYICPDKVFSKGKAQKMEVENPDGEEVADVKKKDKYKGGLVFEPEKGLYDKFILVMDFNSLYPSIIREYNICFTTVDRSEKFEDEEQVPPVPTDQAPGVLPRLIATLVNRRKQVKNLMRDKRATADELASWDIKQLALKLTANSMYGCLGYTRSRFYARPLAMLTTSKGREILRSTKELAESTQLRVIYGDTDSVMINTNADNMQDAMKVGHDFKRAVNDRYKLLEIDIDNIFRRLLLHAKKKYAAINMLEIDGKFVDKLEVKGLDMKRREYCALAKEVSSKLLNEILSGEEAEVVVGRIHEHLRELSEKMRENTLPIQKYIIYTKLGKNPKDYPNSDSMPQVQVALRAMAQGKTVRVNDVMSFIVTGDSKSSESAAKRAFAPQDVLKADSGLKPDVDWYLYKQIFPPIERLCAPIDGTDAIRLAECLGLDTRKYAIHSSSSAAEQQELFPLESQIADEVRFQDAARLSLRCRACKAAFVFDGLLNTPLEACSPNGLTCPSPSCAKQLPNISVVAQLEHQIRQQTARYYEGWLVCDDPSCGNRTRQMSVYGHRCLGPQGLGKGCLGRMGYEYTEKMMYNQLLYFQSLWDVNKAKTKANLKGGEGKEQILALAEHNRERFATLKGVVDRYLDKCGRQWVAMDSLFGFAVQASAAT